MLIKFYLTSLLQLNECINNSNNKDNNKNKNKNKNTNDNTHRIRNKYERLNE